MQTSPSTTVEELSLANDAGTVVLDAVTKRFGAAVAVDSLSLRVERGEFVSLLGPSGCGKTTTLRMIAGFEYPDEGDIRISGTSVLGVPPYRRNVNTVFQAYALFPHMTVAENVAYGLQQKRVAKSEIRDRVAESLDMMQMRQFADRKPTQLSGGQEQRVALARALVNRPSVLLLDEPLSALDRQLREEMQIELKLLQSRVGISFIFVTHDQHEALSMSDRVAVMRAGRIEQLADTDTVYREPANAYVAGFIGLQNFIDGTVRGAHAAETPIGVVSSGASRTPGAEGAPVRVAVRPEFVGLQPATSAPASAPHLSSDVNQYSVTVVSVAHGGETVQFIVDAGNGVILQSRLPAPSAPRLYPGDSAVATFSTDCVQFFSPTSSPTNSLTEKQHHTDKEPT